MKRKIYGISTFILFLIILFQIEDCFASNVFTDIRLRNTDSSDLVVDLYAFSDDVNVYGILGTLEYDTEALSLSFCTGMDDFNVVYSDNKILADDYRKHNNFFSFATCTFEVKETAKSLASTTVGFKNASYSNYEQTYFIKDANLQIDLNQYFNSLVVKDSTNVGNLLKTYLPTIFLAIILGIQLVVICFLIRKRIRHKKDGLSTNSMTRDDSIHSDTMAEIPQNSFDVPISVEPVVTDSSTIPTSNGFNVGNSYINFSSMSPTEPISTVEQNNFSSNRDSFSSVENTVEQKELAPTWNSLAVEAPSVSNHLGSVPSVTEVNTIEVPEQEDSANTEVGNNYTENIIPEAKPIEPNIITPSIEAIGTPKEEKMIHIDSVEVPNVVSIPEPEVIPISSDSVEKEFSVPVEESQPKEQVIEIPVEETFEQQVIEIPTEEMVPKEQIITIPEEIEATSEESVICIPDDEATGLPKSTPYSASNHAFQFITDDSSKF